MHYSIKTALIALTMFICAGIATEAAGEEPIQFGKNDWPWWRGPNRNGIGSTDQQPPLQWSATENVLWRAEVPGRGHGSPTVVGDRVYLTAADEKAQIQSVLCFDRATGKRIWKTDVHEGGFEKKGNKRASHASCSIACDGSRLFVNFNHNHSIYTTALDLDGKKLWQRKICDYVTHQGYGASPAVFGDYVYVSSDNKGGGVLVALKRSSGEVVWTQQRPATANYASPIILNVDGKDQIFMSGCNLVASYDPKTGKPNWEIKGATTECVTSTVTDGKVIFTSGGYPKNHIAAVRADGSGVAWESKTRVYVPSMIVKDGYLYSVTDIGVIICTETATGKEMWKSRLGGTFNASLVLAGSNLFATNEDGRTFVVKANPKEFEIVAENNLGRDIYATPTICGSRIYMRVVARGEGRQEYLYCLGKKEK